MSERGRSGCRSAFLHAGTSSFSDFAAQVAPDRAARLADRRPRAWRELAPHGTTIVAATFPGGVVVAGDRRATMGNMIAQRDIEKVFPADEFSIIGIAGAAGIAVEMVGLFQVELEHYEKIEGAPLSLVGKANRLATMIRHSMRSCSGTGALRSASLVGARPRTQPHRRHSRTRPRARRPLT